MFLRGGLDRYKWRKEALMLFQLERTRPSSLYPSGRRTYGLGPRSLPGSPIRPTVRDNLQTNDEDMKQYYSLVSVMHYCMVMYITVSTKSTRNGWTLLRVRTTYISRS